MTTVPKMEPLWWVAIKARNQAGHSRVETTVQHYVDPRLLPIEPLVPRLPIPDSSRERTLFES